MISESGYGHNKLGLDQDFCNNLDAVADPDSEKYLAPDSVSPENTAFLNKVLS
jgi:hypothetical protein